MSDCYVTVARDWSGSCVPFLREEYASVGDEPFDPATMKPCGSEWCGYHMPISDKNSLCADCRRTPFCIDCGKHRRMNDYEATDLCHRCFEATYFASSDEESSDEESSDEELSAEDPMSRD